MNEFIIYSLMAAFFWGVMGVTESVAGQYSMYSMLVIKYFIYGFGGLALVLMLRGWQPLETDLRAFAAERPGLMATAALMVLLGLFGTYFAYKSFSVCGSNKGLSVIISYCVPVVIVFIASYFILGEQYNMYALLGLAMILGGVLLIDVLGVVNKKPSVVSVTTSPTRIPIEPA